jgi:hypothetical protein
MLNRQPARRLLHHLPRFVWPPVNQVAGRALMTLAHCSVINVYNLLNGVHMNKLLSALIAAAFAAVTFSAVAADAAAPAAAPAAHAKKHMKKAHHKAAKKAHHKAKKAAK